MVSEYSDISLISFITFMMIALVSSRRLTQKIDREMAKTTKGKTNSKTIELNKVKESLEDVEEKIKKNLGRGISKKKSK